MLNRAVSSLCRHSLFTLLFALALAPGLAQTIPNPSFEVDSYASGVGYASQNGGVITGWTMSNPSSIGLNLSGTNNPGLFADNGAIPDGTNVAFVQGMANSQIDQAMVQSMNQVAHALGKQTIAEYVENEATLELLRSYGVDYAQGNYIGKPREALMNLTRIPVTRLQVNGPAD